MRFGIEKWTKTNSVGLIEHVPRLIIQERKKRNRERNRETAKTANGPKLFILSLLRPEGKFGLHRQSMTKLSKRNFPDMSNIVWCNLRSLLVVSSANGNQRVDNIESGLYHIL